MMELGYLGLGDLPAAKEHLEALLALDASQPGPKLHLRLVQKSDHLIPNSGDTNL